MTLDISHLGNEDTEEEQKEKKNANFCGIQSSTQRGLFFVNVMILCPLESHTGLLRHNNIDLTAERKRTYRS